MIGVLCIVPLEFKPYVKRKPEIEIKGEEFIDSLPRDLIIHDTVFKKVYEQGVEFKGVPYVKNYIKNRALEDVSPIISDQLMLIDKKIELLNKKQKIPRNTELVKIIKAMAEQNLETAAGLNSVTNILKMILPKEELKKEGPKTKTPEYIG